MNKFILILLFLLFQGCGSLFDRETQLQNIVDNKVSKDLSVIGTMAAKYEAIFTHYENKTFGLDDVYIKKALYKVVYGFDIEYADIRVKKVNGNFILNVKLPPPIEIKEARNRLITELDKRFSNYYPKDKNGNKIDVSQALDDIVEKQIRVHEKQHIRQARIMTKQYFQVLADNYGMKLNYSMAN